MSRLTKHYGWDWSWFAHPLRYPFEHIIWLDGDRFYFFGPFYVSYFYAPGGIV